MTERHRLPEAKIDEMAHKIHERVVPEEPWEMCPGMHGDHHRLAHLLGAIVAPDTITRYFEAHITCEEHPDMDWDTFAHGSSELGWKASKFEHDEVDDIAGKWFLSARDQSYAKLENEVRGMINGLGGSGFEVLRYKIEETLLDSKLGDTL